MMKTILCYGDSNTWGYVPTNDHSLLKKRYFHDQRWPGVLQKILGKDYLILEEGLNSRTTNIDYAVPPDRNGKTYLAPCLYTHSPIDLVIFALGGNDAKSYFNRSAEQIRDGMAELVNIVQASVYGKDLQNAPKVLLLTPCVPLSFVENMTDENGAYFLADSVAKITQVVFLYEILAKEKNCFYLDLSDIKPSSLDGVHYDQAAHNECAKVVSAKIKEIFS